MQHTSLTTGRPADQVEDMLRQGTAFELVEDAIERARLSPSHKAALWLLAWSLRDPAEARRDARLMAAGFATDARSRKRLRLLSSPEPSLSA